MVAHGRLCPVSPTPPDGARSPANPVMMVRTGWSVIAPTRGICMNPTRSHTTSGSSTASSVRRGDRRAGELTAPVSLTRDRPASEDRPGIRRKTEWGSEPPCRASDPCLEPETSRHGHFRPQGADGFGSHGLPNSDTAGAESHGGWRAVDSHPSRALHPRGGWRAGLAGLGVQRGRSRGVPRRATAIRSWPAPPPEPPRPPRVSLTRDRPSPKDKPGIRGIIGRGPAPPRRGPGSMSRTRDMGLSRLRPPPALPTLAGPGPRSLRGG